MGIGRPEQQRACYGFGRTLRVLPIAVVASCCVAVTSAAAQDLGCDEVNLGGAVAQLTTTQLIEMDRLGEELDALALWNRIDAESHELRREQGDVVEDTPYRQEARAALARALTDASAEPARMAELTEALSRGELWRLLPREGRSYQASGDGTRLRLSRDEAQVLLLLHAIAPLLAERLAQSDPLEDPSATITELILVHQEHVRAVARVRRMLRAPAWTQRLVGFNADEWRPLLATVAPDLRELSGTTGTRLSHEAQARLVGAVTRAQEARLSGELLDVRRRAHREMDRVAADLAELRRAAACARRLIDDVRRLREVPLQPPGVELTPDAIRLALRLENPVIEELSVDAVHRAELVLSVPRTRANGPTLELSRGEEAVGASSARSTGISVRALQLETELDETGRVIAMHPRIAPRGIATALSVDLARAQSALFQCDASDRRSDPCLFELPAGLDLEVRELAFDVTGAWLRVEVASEPWLPRSDPLVLWVTSGRTKVSDIRRSIERALADAITERARTELAEALGVDDVLAITVDPGPPDGPRFPDGVVRGAARIQLEHARPLHQVDVRWRLERGGALRIYSARVSEDARRAVHDAARSWLTEWMSRTNPDIDLSHLRALSSYVAIDGLDVMLAPSGRPIGLRGRLSLGAAVPLPRELRDAISGLEIRYERGDLAVEIDAERLRRLLEGRLREVAERLLRTAGVRVAEIAVGQSVELFGATFTITAVDGQRIDVEGRIGATRLTLQGIDYHAGRLDLSGVRVSGPLIDQLVQAAQELLPALPAANVLALSNPRFGTGHLIVDVTLCPTVLGSEIPLGSVEISARGGAQISASALRAIHGALRSRFDAWLQDLPDGLLTFEGVAEVRELRLDPDFRLFGGVRVALDGTVRLADVVSAGVRVRLLPSFEISLRDDPETVLLRTLEELGAEFLHQALTMQGGPSIRIRPVMRPFGLEVERFEIPIWGDAFRVRVGGLRLTTQGVELPTRFGATLPFDIPLTPFILVNPGFEIDVREIAVEATGDLTLGSRGIERLIKIACRLRAGFRDLRFQADGTVVFLSLLPIARVDGIVDLPRLRATLNQRIIGPLSRILQVQGTSTLDGEALLYSSRAHIEVLGLRLAEASFQAGVRPPHIQAGAQIELPIVSAGGELHASLDLSRVKIEAQAEFRIGGWDIAGAEILLRLSRCKIEFHLLGFRLMAIVPGPADLTPGLIWDLLAGIFSFDPVAFFRNLAKGEIVIDLVGGRSGEGEEDGAEALGEGDPVRAPEGREHQGRSGGDGSSGGGTEDIHSETRTGADAGPGPGPSPRPQPVPTPDPGPGPGPSPFPGPGPGPSCRFAVDTQRDGPLAGLDVLTIDCGQFGRFWYGAVGPELAAWIRNEGARAIIWTLGDDATKPPRWVGGRLEYRAPGRPDEGGGARVVQLEPVCANGSFRYRRAGMSLYTFVLVTPDHRIHALQTYAPFPSQRFGYAPDPLGCRRHEFSWRNDGPRFRHRWYPPEWMGTYCLGPRQRFSASASSSTCDAEDITSGLLFCGTTQAGQAEMSGGEECAWARCVDPDPGCVSFTFQERSGVSAFQCANQSGAQCLRPLLMDAPVPIEIDAMPDFMLAGVDRNNLYGTAGRRTSLTAIQRQIWEEYVRAFLDGEATPRTFSLDRSPTLLHGLSRPDLVVTPSSSLYPALRLTPLGGTQIVVERSSRAYAALGLSRLDGDARTLTPEADLLIRMLLSARRPTVIEAGSALLLHDAARGPDGEPTEPGRVWLVRSGRLTAAAQLATPWAARVAEPVAVAGAFDLKRAPHAAFLAQVLRHLEQRALEYRLPERERRDDEASRPGPPGAQGGTDAATRAGDAQRRNPLPMLYYSRTADGSGRAFVLGNRVHVVLEEDRGRGLPARAYQASRRELETRLHRAVCRGLLEAELVSDLRLRREACGEEDDRVPITPARAAVLARLFLSDDWRRSSRVHPLVLFIDPEQGVP